ncbi:hypothetical protein FQV27_05500 [Paracoccus aurantiacus]|uniref:Uncharacterized protein n=1 Tax=Paracoccus aurantiacus TaxID=2599412 RepID=A0A5C6S413_9RHOB|nr:Imm26 family immunity protein [Paracoccus aurantiacus]TXB69578.1 hypothetical protein FQV27_05500 [Paracoccus aurantiacus]
MHQRRTAKDGYDWFGRKFKGVEAGSVFAVPLSDGTYAFGRLMNAKDGATIAEFFRARRDTPDFDDGIINSGRLFGPTGVLITAIDAPNRKRPWKVVHKDADFYPDDLYDIRFARGTGPGNWAYFTLENQFETLGPLSDDDVGSWRVGFNLPQQPETLTQAIERRLEAEGL